MEFQGMIIGHSPRCNLTCLSYTWDGHDLGVCHLQWEYGHVLTCPGEVWAAAHRVPWHNMAQLEGVQACLCAPSGAGSRQARQAIPCMSASMHILGNFERTLSYISSWLTVALCFFVHRLSPAFSCFHRHRSTAQWPTRGCCSATSKLWSFHCPWSHFEGRWFADSKIHN